MSCGTVSYVVAHHFGIHNPFSSDYLKHWGNTSRELCAELDVVRRTAAFIIQRLEEPTVEFNLINGELAEPEVSASLRGGYI